QLFVYLMKRAYDARRLSADFIPIGALTDGITLLTSPKGQCFLMGLGQLALEGLENSQVLFEASELKTVLRKAMPAAYEANEQACFGDVFYSGLVRGFTWHEHHDDFEGQGEFLHLTLQEYLAAWVFAEQWKNPTQADNNRLFVQRYKYDVHFARFWPFVMGLLAEASDRQYLDKLVACMDMPPLPLNGTCHPVLRIRCLEELLPGKVPLAWQGFVRQLSYEATNRGNIYYYTKALIVEELRQSPAWGKQLAPLFAQSLMSESVKTRKEVLDCIAKLGYVVASELLITGIVEGLSAKTELAVRRAAIRALGALGAVAVTPSILTALTNLLQDNDARVCASACDAVGALGAEASPHFLATLVDLLQNKNARVRASACKALGRLGAAAATPSILTVLAGLLRDNESSVRASVGYAVKGLGSAAATPDFLAALADLLHDNDARVRASACDVVGALGTVAATLSILAALARLLQDKRAYVCASACDAVGTLGVAAVTPSFLAVLTALLQDEASSVRTSAGYAVGMLGVVAVTSFILGEAIGPILAGLIACLPSNKARAHASACGALRQIIGFVNSAAEEAWLTELLHTVRKTLNTTKNESLLMLLMTIAQSLPIGVLLLPHLADILKVIIPPDYNYNHNNEVNALLLTWLQPADMRKTILSFLATYLNLDKQPHKKAIMTINSSYPLLSFLAQVDKPLSTAIQLHLLRGIDADFNHYQHRFDDFSFVLHTKRDDGYYPVSRLNSQGQLVPECTVYLTEQEVATLLTVMKASQQSIDLPLSLKFFLAHEEKRVPHQPAPTTTDEKENRLKRKRNSPPSVTQLFFQQPPTLHFDHSPVYAGHLAPHQMSVIGQAYMLPAFSTQSGEIPMKKTPPNEAPYASSGNNVPQANGALISARLIEVKNKITMIQEKLRFSQGLGKETTDVHLQLLLNRLQEEEAKMGGGLQSSPLIIADKITAGDMETILISIEAIENQIPVLSSSPPLQRGSINPGIVGGLYAQGGASSVAQVEGISYTKAEEKIHVIDIDYVDLPLNDGERLALQLMIQNEGATIFGYIPDSIVKEDDCIIQISFKSESAAKKCQKLIEQGVLRFKNAPSHILLPQG
ncbi:MAG: HEAT repeat domain-containing protein, partial [Gammaproteobacteria bacterium]|nr:HEAT repeat domain-containing protein [Gammaproteobacteria bacterium]